MELNPRCRILGGIIPIRGGRSRAPVPEMRPTSNISTSIAAIVRSRCGNIHSVPVAGDAMVPSIEIGSGNMRFGQGYTSITGALFTNVSALLPEYWTHDADT